MTVWLFCDTVACGGQAAKRSLASEDILGTLRTGLPATLTAKDRLIVAIDDPNYQSAASLFSLLVGHVGGFKVGGVLLTEIGTPAAVGLAKSVGAMVVMDAKLHDTPATMSAAACAADNHRVDMITVHASAGIVGMKAVMESLRKVESERELPRPRPRVMAVTSLTSMSDPQCAVVYHRRSADLVHDFGHDAAAADVDGLVCSPLELSLLRGWEKTRNMTLVAAGIRPKGSPKRGQERVETPFFAISHGADYIIVGDPITKPMSGTCIDAARSIIEEIKAGLSER